MIDPGKVTKHQLDELGLPKPLDEFEVVDETPQEASPHETLLSRPEVGAVAAIEALKVTEKTYEPKNESAEEQKDIVVNIQPETLQTSQPITSQPTITKDPEVQKVESILAQGLEDEYKKLPPSLQEKFRVTGEETASKIVKLLRAAHVNVKKIIHLIRKWLRIIPHINKYYLEQEAKIKADELIKR